MARVKVAAACFRSSNHAEAVGVARVKTAAEVILRRRARFKPCMHNSAEVSKSYGAARPHARRANHDNPWARC